VRQRNVGGSAKRGGSAQRDGGGGGSATALRRRWRQRDSAMSAAAWRQRSGGGSVSGGGGSATALRRRWRQRDIATSAEAWRQHGGGGSVSGGGVSAKRGGGGGAQRYGSSMVEAARRLMRWRQCDSATSAAARSAHLGRRMRQQKTKKINQIVGLGGSRTMILLNNQPKMCRHDGEGIIRDALPDGEVRGARSHRFWGDRVGRRLKNEIK
jgi:hypothetical protein